MSKTVNLDLPDDLAGWREATERAKNIYWMARRDGKSENDALYAVLDDCLRDQFDYEAARRNSSR
jgi:hypothetical protein